MTVDVTPLAGAGRPPLGSTHVEHVMGTAVSFRILPTDGATPGLVSDLLREACGVLHDCDAVFSTWDPTSPMSQLRAGVRSLDQCPPVVEEVLELCAIARERSAGWFDPWAMHGGVDPTGLVKGLAAERALSILRVPEITAALVNAGGDVAGFGGPSPGARWRIGIRHPWRADAFACVVDLDGAVATSATYERGAHLVDPHTRVARARAVSATVCGPSLAMADALATALAVGGDEALAAVETLDGYAGYLIRPDGSETSSPGMPFSL
ncbi:MAG: FAD:protein FMN transferase [Acidimicrobiales bacterium]